MLPCLSRFSDHRGLNNLSKSRPSLKLFEDSRRLLKSLIRAKTCWNQDRDFMDKISWSWSKLLKVSKVSKSRQVITVLGRSRHRSRQIIDLVHINFFVETFKPKAEFKNGSTNNNYNVVNFNSTRLKLKTRLFFSNNS